MRIRALAANVANQIAAGEVIERPASVVKELLENALDAKSSQIHVEIGFGGLNLIQVSDNGLGIHEEDMHLAITAHATSKISQLSDLYQIASMGFRGEALASIASISRMSLHSKSKDQAHGVLLTVDDQAASLRLCPRTQGTTVSVHDLFYNAPVRKSFLKSERLEYQAIEMVVKQFALSAPMVAISLTHNGQLIWQLAPGDSESAHVLRLKKLFGQAFLNDALYIEEEQASVEIKGWISRHVYQRSQRDKQWVYLNQRFVKDKLIFQALNQAYESILHPGRYASCLLYLTMPAHEVDVNVHPTKHEVRFAEPRKVHSLILTALSKGLDSTRPEQQIPKQAMQGSSLAKAKSQGQFVTALAPMTMEWQIINAAYLIMPLFDKGMHLINIKAVHQMYLKEQLQPEHWPLPARPLLVPVSCPLTHPDVLDKHQPLMTLLGIDLSIISPTKFLIRSLPICLPMLNIDVFFAGIQSKDRLGQFELIALIIESQSLNLYNISPLELEGLVLFCAQKAEVSDFIRASCLRLDEKNCDRLIRDISHE